MNVKQVIVMRRDLNMRRGKEIAQGAHAAMLWLIERTKQTLFIREAHDEVWPRLDLTEAEEHWLDKERMRKVTVYVQSEAELLLLQRRAEEAGLEAHVVTDLGLTEFNGVPTKTALAIGPDLDEKLDPITGHLPLY